ncbi:MAG: ATP-binding cassette domain-containing protein [Lachnospiraceae bacterium]|nr:ATP-binding cassette domain-containing protein [Lachnospiraceae bacterium]
MYLELKNISKRFSDAKADEPDTIKDVSLGIEKGELVALLGPSGGGKTTLLRMIAGLDNPTDGDILIEGNRVNDLSPSERHIGFVFQNYALFRYMTVFDNIAFGLEVQKKDKAFIKNRVHELLSLIEMDDFDQRFPNQLSGGQRQRVAFARALATEPSLLLLDEPFAAIDSKVRKELREWLRNMIHEVGITSIFVTHDQQEAVDMADRIVIIKDGKLEQMGNPYEIYKNPRTFFTSTFMGDSTVKESFSGFTGFPDIEDGSKIVIRPEYVEAFRDDNPKFKNMIPFSENGTVKDVIFRGDSLDLILDVNGVELKTKRSLERRPVKKGDSMRVIVYRIIVYGNHKNEVLKNEKLKNVDIEFI